MENELLDIIKQRMEKKWNNKPWQKSTEKWKANAKKILAKITDVEGGILYIFVTTKNTSFAAGAGNAETVAKDALSIYRANGVDWLKQVAVVYDTTEFEFIRSNLKMTNSIVEYTDDSSMSQSSKIGFGNTPNFFNSYIYIGPDNNITQADTNVIGYTTAHELLHQIVSRIGYFIYGNVSFYQHDEFHFEHGHGLLTNAQYLNEYSQGVITRPVIRGTGIEKIADEMILDVRGLAQLITPSAPLLKLAGTDIPQSEFIPRYKFIMANNVTFGDESLKSSELNNGNRSIYGDIENYLTIKKDSEGHFIIKMKPVYVLLNRN